MFAAAFLIAVSCTTTTATTIDSTTADAGTARIRNGKGKTVTLKTAAPPVPAPAPALTPAAAEESKRGLLLSGGTVRVFRQKFTLEDAIGPHASWLEASRRVTNGIPLGCPHFLQVRTVNCIQTLKV
jgi:hypothetical protein